MKKFLFALFASLLFAISSYSQGIRREFFGVQLGASKDLVLSKLKSENYNNLDLRKADAICIKNASFAGVSWDFVYFQFTSDGILYEMDFCIDKKDKMYISLCYQLCKEKLSDKYKAFCIRTSKDKNGLKPMTIDDTKTSIWLFAYPASDGNGNYTLALSYSDNKLKEKKENAGL